MFLTLSCFYVGLRKQHQSGQWSDLIDHLVITLLALVNPMLVCQEGMLLG